MKLITVWRAMLFATLLLFSCSSPPAQPLVNQEVALDLEARSDNPEVLEAALSMISSGELALLPSDWQDHLSDPGHPSYWQTRSLVWSPEVRLARRNLQASAEAAKSAGFPGPLSASLRNADFDDADLSNEVVATFDLLGVLGLGPAAAAVQLADAQVRASWGELEIAVWQAKFESMRALIRLVTTRAELRELTTHLTEAQKGGQRAKLLSERGRLGNAPISRMSSFVSQLATRVSALKAEEAQRLNDLLVIAGLSPKTPMNLDEIGANTTAEILQELSKSQLGEAKSNDHVALLNSHPELRQLHLEYAIAEARIRQVAAEAWPQINIGPRFDIKPDSLLTGGVIRLSLPWPGSLEGRIQAAVANRSAARERLENGLVRVSARLSANAQRANILGVAQKREAIPALSASAKTWRGMQARFQVDESIWDLWTDALQLRRNAITAHYSNQRNFLLATIDQSMDEVVMEAINE